MNMKNNYVVYSLSAFENCETEYSSLKFHVVSGILAVRENYEIKSHYFQDLHKDLQNLIDYKLVQFEGTDITYNFIACCVLKALLNVMGSNCVSGKYHCIYCKT
jgi:hypothetical protein